MDIRRATKKDLDDILKIYAHARQIMQDNGNPSQWGGTYPPKELVEEDIRLGRCHICEVAGEPVGVFVFFIGEEPNYAVIEGGEWSYKGVCGIIHRVATNGKARGVAGTCFEYCRKQIPHLRIDTHRDNIIMQGALTKFGFKHCGTVYMGDGTPRLAYEYVKE